MTENVSLRLLFHICRMKKGSIFTITLLSFGILFYTFSYRTSPIYEAKTRLVSNQIIDATPDLEDIRGNIRMMDTYKEILKSPIFLQKVLNQFPEFSLSLSAFKNQIRIAIIADTQVMTIAVRNRSYQRAAQLANAMTTSFLKEMPDIFDTYSLSLVDQAKVKMSNISPIKPNIPLNFVISMYVSLFLGLSWGILRYVYGAVLTSEEEIEQFLELPVLAVIEKRKQK